MASGAVDVTVVGAGVLGLASAWACLARGARVRVVEARAVAAGASGTPVGALAPHVPEQWNAKKQFQFEALAMAEGYWQGIAAAGGGDPGFARLGRLQPLPDDRAVARAEARGNEALELWQGRFAWAVRPATDFGAFAPESPTGLLVHDTLSARINPRAACAALGAAIVARGGALCEGVTGPLAGRVIWANGVAGLAALSADLGRAVGAEVKGQAALLAHDAGRAPQIHADGVLIVPQADGTVAVGSTTERSFARPFHTDALLDEVIARARGLCPALRAAPVIERWAGLRPRAASLAPLVDAWPGRAGHFIANGGFKIGIGLAPKLGEAVAAMVLEGTPPPPEFSLAASLAKAPPAQG